MIRHNFLRSVLMALALITFLPLAGTGFGVFSVQAAQAQTVSRIAIDGNSRVDDATLKNYLTIKVGDRATSAAIQASIASLNATGLFSSVNVRYSGGVLRVSVSENPIVASVLFEGNQRFSDENLLAMVNLASRGTFTQERLANDVASIRSAYDDVGYTDVSVTTRVETVQDGRKRVVFVINEGNRAGIAAINFTGNNAFSSGTLKNVIQSKESHLLSWLLNDDELQQDKLDLDKERIRYFYVNRGYPDARVLSAVSEYDASRGAYFVNFTISEGDYYNFGSIGIETSIPGLDTEALKSNIRTYEGNPYSFSDLQKSVEDMAFRATRQGFAFADVRPRLDRDVVNKVFNVTYLVDEGARVYVERVNIVGNTRTRDFVIRRELDFAEGDPFNRSMVSRAKAAIEKLGFFSSVGITTQAGSAPDKVVLTVAVVEKSTGNYGASGGYSSADGILGEISLTESNFLGRGQYVKVALGATANGQTYDFSFTEPRFMGLKISSGIDLYKRVNAETETNYFGYDSNGGQIRFGVPITEELTANLMAGVESKTFTDSYMYDHDNDPNTPKIPHPTAFGDSNLISDGDTLNKLFFGYTLTYNTTNSPISPTDGLIATFSQQYVGWGQNYLRTEAKARYFKELVRDSGVVASIRGQAGVVSDLGGSGAHATETYFKGPNLVRGFQGGGMGPRAANGELLGSMMFAGISAELEFPIPVLPESYGIHGAVWADVGYLSGASPSVSALTVSGNTQQVRTSVGASIIWNSPFGPLRGDFAHVIQQDTGDKTQVFQFTISTLL